MQEESLTHAPIPSIMPNPYILIRFLFMFLPTVGMANASPEPMT
jgi:hypothetical protein